MTTSTWRCSNGHVYTSPKPQTACAYPKCDGEMRCTAGPLKPKAAHHSFPPAVVNLIDSLPDEYDDR